MNIEAGQRVVRGPNWKWDNQDGGEGHVGTVTGSSLSPLTTTVDIVWDSGDRNTYRTGAESSYDLRLLDNAACGVEHQGIVCSSCDEVGIAGMRWTCVECLNLNLCTMCYMTDKHDVEHTFRRIASPQSESVRVPKRSGSVKRVAWGIFPSAKVKRGHDWKGGTADDGHGTLGTVIEIKGWTSETARSAATIKWQSSRGSTASLCRCGHEGKVDIAFTSAAEGGKYYRDHLPVLGRMDQTSPKSERIKTIYKAGDKVAIQVQVSKLQELQLDHGGWTSRMAEVIGNVGSVRRITDKGDVVVQFDTDQWILNPKALVKVQMKVGDTVFILSDLEKVKELQKGHGGWNDSMKKVLGKTGTLKHIDSDGDCMVFFGNCVFLFNSACCLPASANHAGETRDGQSSKTTDNDDTDDSLTGMKAKLRSLLLDFSQLMGPDKNPTLLMAVYTDNVKKVRRILAANTENVNGSLGGQTALHLACYKGNVEIVDCLLQAGADVSIQDNNGYISLHYAAYKNRPEIITRLLQHGAPVNAANSKGHTALFVAVNEQNPDCVAVLLAQNCDVNLQDSVGDTALYDAIRCESMTIVRQLTECSSTKYTVRNKKGFFPLHYAALRGNAYAADRILERSNNLVDQKMEEGWAALHIASINGHLEVVKALVLRGDADVNIKGVFNHTPIQLAMSTKHKEVVEFLMQHGARKPAEGASQVDFVEFLMQHVARKPAEGASQVECPIS